MKKISIFTLSIFISIITFSQSSEEYLCSEELKVFGKSILKTIQDGNIANYKKYIVTVQDVDTIAKYMSVRNDRELVDTSSIKNAVRHLSRLLENKFNEIITQGKEQGIDWNSVELIDFMCEIRGKEDEPRGEIFLVCKHNDMTFGILLGIVAVKDKWLLFDKTEFVQRNIEE